MPYPHVTQFETFDMRRHEALRLLAEQARTHPKRGRRSRSRLPGLRSRTVRC